MRRGQARRRRKGGWVEGREDGLEREGGGVGAGMGRATSGDGRAPGGGGLGPGEREPVATPRATGRISGSNSSTEACYIVISTLASP